MSVEDIFPLAVEFRRHFHQHPEFAMQEVETQRYITKVLDKYGIVYRTVGTGVIAMIGQGEKCVAIRADMDALKVTEETGLPFCYKTWFPSEVSNKRKYLISKPIPNYCSP